MTFQLCEIILELIKCASLALAGVISWETISPTDMLLT